MGIEFTYFQPSNGAQDSFIYPLTAILFLFACIAFLKSNFDILNPSFVYSISLTSCCSLVALYTNAWNLPMHFNTAMIIIVMSIFFFVGGNFAEYVNRVNYLIQKDNYEAGRCEGFFINWKIWLVAIAILSYFLYLNYRDFIDVARQVTNETSFVKMLYPVVDGFAHQQIELSRWNAQRMRISEVISYISIFAIWVNLIGHKHREILKWSVLAVQYIPFMVLTGGRQQFLYLILFSVMSYFLVYRKFSKGKRNLVREFTVIVGALFIFLVFFLGIGVINGKIGENSSALKVLVHYAGTNISAFDVYINEILLPDNQAIGTLTLGSVYRFLQSWGFHVPLFIQYISLFTEFGPVTTNVYTAFFRYIQDFGYVGCSLIMFLLGFFYTFIYREIYHYGLKNWMILVYCSIAYPIFLVGREERFFREILTTGELTFIVEIIAFYSALSFLQKPRRILK